MYIIHDTQAIVLALLPAFRKYFQTVSQQTSYSVLTNVTADVNIQPTAPPPYTATDPADHDHVETLLGSPTGGGTPPSPPPFQATPDDSKEPTPSDPAEF